MAEWYGSKGASGLSQAIVSAMPAHDLFIESHLGGGAIMKRKPPGAAQHRHRPQPPVDRQLQMRLPCRASPWLRPPLPVRLRLPGPRAGLLRPALRAVDAQGAERRYRFDYTDDDHAELLGILKSLPCQVMVSGYPSALYDAHLDGWRSLEVQVNNQACVVTEKLWFNFEPDRPHWHTCAGRNFTDRQRIKRNAERWARRYRAMPPGERLAVLAAVMAVEAEE